MSWFEINDMAIVACGPKSKPELGMKWIKENNITSWAQFPPSSVGVDIARMLYTGLINRSRKLNDREYFTADIWLNNLRIYKQKFTKRCFLVVHNYDQGQTFPELIDWCHTHQFHLIKEKESWYGYGTTTYIITPKDPEFLKKRNCRK